MAREKGKTMGFELLRDSTGEEIEGKGSSAMWLHCPHLPRAADSTNYEIICIEGLLILNQSKRR